ncbi:hypothetical protein B0I35DRAFT_478916 [Stachybotrys elegans]|uniref:DUF1754-domain-containing protein n=1 Tax=Stachybotrys elegans TaxID=80388 RepID=A0A8K0SM22_9HYPO|nr:hypothetical protein B0I35DRAFT_478916 [Stachybotrys elegans]
MPADEYSAARGGGALKLKGAKIEKKKKKSKAKRDKSDLARNLSAGEEDGGRARSGSPAEKRNRDDEELLDERGDDDAPAPQKTESERQFEERKRKRLLKMAESSAARPELLMTHKERVEKFNTYLSKLSEHHDMPKIGPG